MKLIQTIVNEKGEVLSPKQEVPKLMKTYGVTVKVPVLLTKRNTLTHTEYMVWKTEYEKKPFNDDLFITVKCKRVYPQTEPERYAGRVEFPDPS